MWPWRRKKKGPRDQPGGRKESAQVTVPDEHETIQDALDASDDGWIITVRPGRYHENIDFGGKNVTLRSDDPSDRRVVEQTVIDGGGRGSVVSFTAGEGPGAVLTGFTITGGVAPFSPVPAGGGITVRGNSSPTIEVNVVTGNRSELDGGGVFIDDSWPILRRNRIYDNEAVGCGGGVFVGRDSMAHLEVGVSPSSAESMARLLDSASGEGFHLSGVGDTEADESDVEARAALENMVLEDDREKEERPRPQVEGNTINDNRALHGGGLYVSDESPIVRGNVLGDNCAERGGGICLWDNCRAAVSGNRVFNNHATGEGGAVIVEWGASPAILENVISDNCARLGSALSIARNSAPLVRGNRFSGNDSEQGDALYLWEANLAVLEDNVHEEG